MHKTSPLFYLLAIFLAASCVPVSMTPVPTRATSGDILFQDDFAVNTTGWDRVSNANGIMDYDGGGYRILVNQPKLNFWATPDKDFGDVSIEVDSFKLNGPDENRLGLICRYQQGNYYFFVMSSDGFYALGKFIGGNTILFGQSEMQTSSAIKTGTAVNHLGADCVGNTLTFHVNGTSVATAQDADLTSGDVGLLAGAFAQPGVDVLFDNFVVMQP